MMEKILKEFKKNKKWPEVLKICKTLQKDGHTAWLAGGCVRDALLNKNCKDFDIATSAKPEEVEKLFEKTVAVGKSFGVIRVVTPKGDFEVATFRKDGKYEDGRHPVSVEFSAPKEDALRRDFTVNALFYDPSNKLVIDYVDGQKDLKKKIIKTVGDPDQRFSEDKLRILRAVRFVSQLGFKIDNHTERAIERSAGQIHTVSGERLFEELNKLITGKYFDQAIESLENTGLKNELFPAMVFSKSLFKKTQKSKDPVFLRWALLFYLLLQETEREILWSRLKTSQDFREKVESTLRLAEGLKNFKNLTLAQKKQLSAQENTLKAVELCQVLGWIKSMEKTFVYKNRKLPQPLINSKDLIKQGFSPGPRFGEILKDLFNRQLEGEIKTKKQALVFLETKNRT